MVHQGQGLPLGFEPGNNALGIQAQLDDFQSHAAVDWFLLLGHIHYAATALAYLLQQFVTANALSGFRGGNWCAVDDSARSLRNGCRAFEKSAGLFANLKEFFDALTQCGVAGADLIEVGDALRERQFQRRIENFNFAFRWLRHGQIRSFTLQCEKTAQKRQHADEMTANAEKLLQPQSYL
jgi:hypothetical protein